MNKVTRRYQEKKRMAEPGMVTSSPNGWLAAIVVFLLFIELAIIAYLRFGFEEYRLQAHIALATVFVLILLLGAIHSAIG